MESGLILTLDGGRRKKKGCRNGSPEKLDFVSRPRLRSGRLSKRLVAVLEQMVQRAAAAADQRPGSRASTATGSCADAGADSGRSGDCQGGFQLGTAASSDGRARRTIDY